MHRQLKSLEDMKLERNSSLGGQSDIEEYSSFKHLDPTYGMKGFSSGSMMIEENDEKAQQQTEAELEQITFQCNIKNKFRRKKQSTQFQDKRMNGAIPMEQQ